MIRYIIHVAMSLFLHVEGCRTRPDSIVEGHRHLRGVIAAFHLSFVFLLSLVSELFPPCFLPILVLLFGLQESSLEGLLAS
jgi:hypothetical protein